MAATIHVISATRAGQSAVISETTTKTYAMAQPAVLTEAGSGGSSGGGGGGGSTQAFAMVLA